MPKLPAFHRHRFADTFTTRDGQLVERPDALRELLSIAQRNRGIWAEATGICNASACLPYFLTDWHTGGQWVDWIHGFFAPDDAYVLQRPSECPKLAYWIISAAQELISLRPFRPYFQRRRNGSFKVQRLEELHCTPVWDAASQIQVRTTCPRMEQTLGLL